jgi:hopanoid biosynthesis associated protein HpnK
VRQLVITADDFGAAGAVNAAVERAHTEGVLTAASLMVGADAAQAAVALARRLPSLRVGLHLVLVEGRPLSDPAAVPDLVTRDGALRTDMARFGADIFFRGAVRRQLAAEIEAQFQAYARTGLPLDHVNTHKHFHLHPTVQALILEIGPRYGMTAMRAPQEPRRVLQEVEPSSTPPRAYMTAPWARLSRDRLRRAGIATPDQVFGLAWSGAMTPARLGGIIARLPPGLSEIYLHPAIHAYPGSGPGYRHDVELRALIANDVAVATRDGDLALGGYADFAAAAGGAPHE